MIPLNYNQLYYFHKIAEFGSIAQASKKVLISSPALSMQLKELEEHLGTPLFLRVGNKLVLTEAGSIVNEYAKDIFNLGFELKDTLADRGKKRLQIEIGCQDSIPKKIADELVSFLIKSKKCKVILREGNLEALLEKQMNYELDIILTDSAPTGNNSQIFETRQLCHEKMIMVSHPDFKKYKKDWPKSLKDAPVILPTFDSGLRQKLDHFFREINIAPDVVAEVEDKATEIDLALKGFGVVFSMRSAVDHLLQQKLLIEIGSAPQVKEEVWMILGKRKILNPLALFAMKNFNLKS